MAAETEFALLGPLKVRCGGTALPVTAGLQRAVLAALLLSPGRVVTLDELSDVLWGSAPPRSARVAAQNYVMRLRRVLGEAGRRITTQAGGYLIQVAAGELDVSQFEDLLGSARMAAADERWESAAAQAGQALVLWRGPPLADVPSEVLSLREVPSTAAANC